MAADGVEAASAVEAEVEGSGDLAAECLAAAAPVEAGKEKLYGSRFKS